MVRRRAQRKPPVTNRLIVRGAREHNLKDVDLDLPRDAMIVFTGLSGSGKSSLAFDTIFAEGQRRYVESLSSVRAAVPRAAGQARRRRDRGPARRRFRSIRSARRRARGRRSARSPRSMTTCACSGRGSGSRTARCAASRSSGRRRSRSSTICWAGRKGPGSTCSRRSRRATTQGRVRRGCSRGLQAKGYARVRVDGTVYPLAEVPKLDGAGAAHDRGGRRPAYGEGIQPGAADRFGGDRAEARGRPDDGQLHGPARGRPGPGAPLHRASGLPERPSAGDRRARAAVVLVQLAVGRVPGLRRAGHPLRDRSRSWSSRTGAGRWRTGRSRPGPGGRTASTSCGCCGRGRGGRFRHGHPVGQLPDAARQAVLHGTGDQVHVSYRTRAGRERSYHVRFEGVLPWIERRYARPGPTAAGSVRGVHAGGAVPGVRGAPGCAGDPGGDGGRALDRGPGGAAGPGGGASGCGRWR